MLKKRKVFIDICFDWEDFAALLSIIDNPTVEIVGISVTGVAVVYLKPGLIILANMLKYLGKTHIPIFSGYDTPLIYSNVFPPKFRKAANDAFGLPFTDESIPLVYGDAVEGIIDILKNSEEKVDFLLLDGATTFGYLLKEVSSYWLSTKIGVVMVMGGNILPEYLDEGGAYGNLVPIYDNELAEYNVFIDVKAMQDVFFSQLPIKLVTLNATNSLDITQEFVDQVKDIGTRKSDIVYKAINYQIAVGDVHMSLWNSSTVASWMNQELILKSQTLPLCIEQNFVQCTNNDLGKLIVDEHKGYPVDVILKFNAQGVKDFILNALKY